MICLKSVKNLKLVCLILISSSMDEFKFDSARIVLTRLEDCTKEKMELLSSSFLTFLLFLFMSITRD